MTHPSLNDMRARAESLGEKRLGERCTCGAEMDIGNGLWMANVASPNPYLPVIGVYGFETEREAVGALLRALVRTRKRNDAP